MDRGLVRRLSVSAIMSLSWLAAPPEVVQAQSAFPLPDEQQVGEQQVEFRVNVCLASKEEGRVDPECESMQKQLPVRFGTLVLKQRQEFGLAFGERREVGLPSGAQLVFAPISIASDKLRMHVLMRGVVNTRVQLGSGRSMILAGVPYERGNLIVELRPTFVTPPAPQSPMALQEAPPARRRTPLPEVRRVGATGRSPNVR